jgi:uncharacterized protein YaiL (DUF2058 family)
MADSLRDQLIKAGLATAAQGRKAERGSRNSARQQRGQADAPPKARERATKQQEERRERDRAAAQEHNDKAAAHALRAELRQFIRQHDQRPKKAAEDDVPYNFVHGTRIKRIHVPEAMRLRLAAGELVIVNNDGLYHIVTREIGERIARRDPGRIIVANAELAQPPSADDDYYARFEVPDDLDW